MAALGAGSGALPAPAAVKLTDALVSNLAVGKVFQDHQGCINGLDFTYDGLHLVTSGDDNNVYVYSAERAQRTRQLRCEKYGVDLIRLLHNSKDCAVCASRSQADPALRYWDLRANKYLRFFAGHTRRVLSLSPHPYEDLFLSGSEDCSMLLWDLRREAAVAKVTGQGPSHAAFDQQGLVFAACVGPPKLHLFDSRAYGKGEFAAFDLAPYLGESPRVRFVKFSPCGKYVLVRTSAQLILSDAFDGELICEFALGEAPEAAEGSPTPEPGFSPDSQYVLSGVAGGDVCIWSTTNAKLVRRLEGHTGLPAQCTFSPTHALVVSAAETLAWWIPDLGDVGSAGA